MQFHLMAFITMDLYLQIILYHHLFINFYIISPHNSHSLLTTILAFFQWLCILLKLYLLLFTLKNFEIFWVFKDLNFFFFNIISKNFLKYIQKIFELFKISINFLKIYFKKFLSYLRFQLVFLKFISKNFWVNLDLIYFFENLFQKFLSYLRFNFFLNLFFTHYLLKKIIFVFFLLNIIYLKMMFLKWIQNVLCLLCVVRINYFSLSFHLFFMKKFIFFFLSAILKAKNYLIFIYLKYI